MFEDTSREIDQPNRWRPATPGHQGWKRTARPDDPDKYFMVSAGSHANEPANLWRSADYADSRRFLRMIVEDLR